MVPNAAGSFRGARSLVRRSASISSRQTIASSAPAIPGLLANELLPGGNELLPGGSDAAAPGAVPWALTSDPYLQCLSVAGPASRRLLHLGIRAGSPAVRLNACRFVTGGSARLNGMPMGRSSQSCSVVVC